METKTHFKSNFFMDLFEKREIPDVYQKISYADSNKNLYETNTDEQIEQLKHHIYTVALIPDYFNLVLKEENMFVNKTYYQNNLGYAIRIKDIVNVDSYLKSQFKANSKVVKRSLTRLETCFNINYKIVHGSITKEEYDFLMSSLKEMLIRRFAQRNDENQKLKEWDIIVKNTFDQIIRKEASLFIIYDEKKPIDISLNYHFDKIIFSAISSYDIDYHKFGVGHVEMIKLLEWCIKDQYEFLELGYGDLEYKRRWCNHIYQFKYQVVYNQQSLIIPMMARMELYKLSIKEYLKEKKFNLFFSKLRERLSMGRGHQAYAEPDITYEKIDVSKSENFKSLFEIDPNIESNHFLRKPLYEFLYTSQEHKNDTSVYKLSELNNSYLFKAKNNAQQLIIKN